MASIIFDLSGDAALVSKIQALGNGIKPIAVRVLKPLTQPILAQAKANAPVKSGRMRDSLVAKKGYSRNGRVRFIVSTSAGDYQGKEFYGAFVECGHKLGSRKVARKTKVARTKEVPAVRFIGRAFDALASQTQAAMEQGFRTEIEKAAKAA